MQNNKDQNNINMTYYEFILEKEIDLASKRFM